MIIQEAKRKADNPAAVATETLYELLHDRHRIRRWRIGREPGLRALDTRRRWWASIATSIRPGNTILAIVGDVDPDEALADVKRRYGALAAGEPTRTPGPSEDGAGGFRYRELTGDIAQTQLAFGWRTPGTNAPGHARRSTCSAGVLGAGARRDSIARCASGVSRRR